MVTAASPRVLPVGVAATVTLSGSGFESNSTVLLERSGAPHRLYRCRNASGDAYGRGSRDGRYRFTFCQQTPARAPFVSSVMTVPISSQFLPAITGVKISKNQGPNVGCARLLFSISGSNFTYNSNSTVQVNGTTLQIGIYFQDSQNLFWVSSIRVLKQGWWLVVYGDHAGRTGASVRPVRRCLLMRPRLSRCVRLRCQPRRTRRAASRSGSPSAVNATGAEQVTVGSLPSAVTTTTPSVPIAGSSVDLHFQALATVAPGSYQVVLSTGSAQQTDAEMLPLTISASSVPAVSLTAPLSRELSVPFGGSGSIQFGTTVNAQNGTVFDITPSVTGLPPNTFATFSPAVFSPGQSVTVTISATSDAPGCPKCYGDARRHTLSSGGQCFERLSGGRDRTSRVAGQQPDGFCCSGGHALRGGL